MALDPFPVFQSQQSLTPTNAHHVPLDRLPVLEQKGDLKSAGWYGIHVGSQLSARQRRVKKETSKHGDTTIYLKDTIHGIMLRAMGTEGKPPARIFALLDDNTNDCDTFIFVSHVRYDLSNHTMVCDAFVLNLFPDLMPIIDAPFRRLVKPGAAVYYRVYGEETKAWKHLLPALVERCRTSWTHGPNCEYAAKGQIPLELENSEGDPLCSCGRGKDVDGMLRGGELWKKFAPFVTRIALSPLFAVSYLEPVLDRDVFGSPLTLDRMKIGSTSSSSSAGPVSTTSATPPLGCCKKCGKEGDMRAELRRCSRCKLVCYCSETCQKGDWKNHKLSCTTT